MRRGLATVAVSFALLSVGQAADAKDGTDSYTTNYVVTSSNTMKFGDRTFTVLEFGGISRNDRGTGMFDNMAVRCMGTREALAGQVTSRGSCVDVDKDGDQLFTTYESKGNPSAGTPLTGTHVFVGGTGKYTGISGKADYTIEPMKGSDNITGFIIRHKASWKLP